MLTKAQARYEMYFSAAKERRNIKRLWKVTLDSEGETWFAMVEWSNGTKAQISMPDYDSGLTTFEYDPKFWM